MPGIGRSTSATPPALRAAVDAIRATTRPGRCRRLGRRALRDGAGRADRRASQWHAHAARPPRRPAQPDPRGAARDAGPRRGRDRVRSRRSSPSAAATGTPTTPRPRARSSGSSAASAVEVAPLRRPGQRASRPARPTRRCWRPTRRGATATYLRRCRSRRLARPRRSPCTVALPRRGGDLLRRRGHLAQRRGGDLMMAQPDGQVALVTGAASGDGRGDRPSGSPRRRGRRGQRPHRRRRATGGALAEEIGGVARSGDCSRPRGRSRGDGRRGRRGDRRRSSTSSSPTTPT